MKQKMPFLILLLSILLGVSAYSYAETVEYKLTIDEQKVNITGQEATALTLNNTIPGPTLQAKVGDIFRVKVTNNLDIDTSIHWHGVLVPNNMDGVPYVNGPPIKAGETFTYEFPIKHSGTFWYHAHSALQEQQGIYGALVFYPEHEMEHYDEEHVVVLSDWIDENPDQVLANLKKDSDYYALKKDSVQSWLKVFENGTVRPVIAYSFFILYATVKVRQFSADMPCLLWTAEDQAIFAGIISFYFGQRAMAKLRSGK